MAEIKITVPVVVNRCYGSFSLSDDAIRYLAVLKHWNIVRQGRFLVVEHTGKTIESMVTRNDVDLITVVQKLGNKSNGECAELEIVAVEITININNFDGKESIDISRYIEW